MPMLGDGRDEVASRGDRVAGDVKTRIRPPGRKYGVDATGRQQLRTR
jgi:hypothetical protein